MNAWDVVVHASVRPEPFGARDPRGMLLGKPVIATAAGGVPELIDDGATGFLVPPRCRGARPSALRACSRAPRMHAPSGARARDGRANTSPWPARRGDERDLRRAARTHDMNILGISCFYHDAGGGHLVDGQLSRAAEEERFSRKKHDAEFPKLAIQFCLEQAGADDRRSRLRRVLREAVREVRAHPHDRPCRRCRARGRCSATR
jgi:glycosyltransferase involved in cell wall biosynthesis